MINASPTLDGLFRRILARKPDALALLDPPNKQRVTGDPPKRLTFAEARSRRYRLISSKRGCRPTPSSRFNCRTPSSSC